MLSGRLRAAVVLAGARNADANAHIPSVRRRTIGIRIIAADEESSVCLRWTGVLLGASCGAPLLPPLPAPVEKSFKSIKVSCNEIDIWRSRIDQNDERLATPQQSSSCVLCCSLACDRAMITSSPRLSWGVDDRTGGIRSARLPILWGLPCARRDRHIDHKL